MSDLAALLNVEVYDLLLGAAGLLVTASFLTWALRRA